MAQRSRTLYRPGTEMLMLQTKRSHSTLLSQGVKMYTSNKIRLINYYFHYFKPDFQRKNSVNEMVKMVIGRLPEGEPLLYG